MVEDGTKDGKPRPSAGLREHPPLKQGPRALGHVGVTWSGARPSALTPAQKESVYWAKEVLLASQGAKVLTGLTAQGTDHPGGEDVGTPWSDCLGI